jgi:hypothetical protein
MKALERRRGVQVYGNDTEVYGFETGLICDVYLKGLNLIGVTTIQKSKK